MNERPRDGRTMNAHERLRAMSDEDLSVELEGLGRALAWPPTPSLAATVVSRLERAPVSRRIGGMPFGWLARRPLRRATVLALVALLVVAGIVTALGLGVPGIRILFGPTPTPSPSVVTSGAPSASPTTPSAGGLGAALALGRRVGIAEAQAAADYPIVQPTLPSLPPPDEIWLEGNGADAVVSFVWRARGRPAAPGTDVGLLLTEFRGSIDRTLFEKMVGSGTTVEPLTVAGAAGYWLSGAPHDVLVRLPSGDIRSDRVRLAGNVLMWTRGPLTLRLETASGKDDAVQIGTSVR